MAPTRASSGHRRRARRERTSPTLTRLPGGEAELGARDVELATLAEFALLGEPRRRVLLAEPVAANDECPDERDYRCGVGLGIKVDRAERVSLHADVLEPRRAQPGCERARQRWVREVLIPGA